MYKDEDDSIWVHERDYGGNPIGDFLSGFFYLTVGLVQLVLYLFRKKK
jgi:hypothetical protein